MKAIILSAGTGSRLRPYTLDRPKSMIVVKGKSLLERNLACLSRIGIRDITVVTGHQPHLIDTVRAVKTVYNSLYTNSNMVYSLFKAMKSADEDVLIIYGDCVYHPIIFDHLLHKINPINVCVDINWRPYWCARFGEEEMVKDAESLLMDDDGNILDIGQRISSPEQPMAQFMGLCRLNRDGVKIFFDLYNHLGTNAIQNIFFTEFLMLMIQSGVNVNAHEVVEPWVEIDTPRDLCSDFTGSRIKNIDDALWPDVND